MNMTKEEAIAEFGSHPGDTGSLPVQIAMMHIEWKERLLHYKKHPKDKEANGALFRLIFRTEKAEEKLRKTSPEMHEKLMQTFRPEALHLL